MITCQLFKDLLQTFVRIAESASTDAEQTSMQVCVNRRKLKWYIQIWEYPQTKQTDVMLRVKRERNQQDATNLMFIIKLSQHVSGIIMPIIRRTRV